MGVLLLDDIGPRKGISLFIILFLLPALLFPVLFGLVGLLLLLLLPLLLLLGELKKPDNLLERERSTFISSSSVSCL